MHAHRMKAQTVGPLVLLISAVAACSDRPTAPETPVPAGAVASSNKDHNPGRGNGKSDPACATDNAGITLPPGFCAIVFADLVMDGQPAAARHMAITERGDVFVAINAARNRQPRFGIVGLRDNDGDGEADEQVHFSPGLGGSGLAWDHNTLYFGANDRVLRFKIPGNHLTPVGQPETVVSGLPAVGDHISKTVVLGKQHALFVNVGSASNACQVQNRVAQSPGVLPCPELPVRAGVWKFDARPNNQTPASGERYATGLRNTVALAMNPRSDELWGVPHGRDMLFENWPQFFTQQDDAVLPAEEFVRITRNSNTGWPYCYFDAITQQRKVLAPEYGGDGTLTNNGASVNCASYNQPLVTFGAHWAPNGLHFYTGKQFPERYRNGAFVAFHGGFDRAPLPNEGYQVQFVPFNGSGRPAGPAEEFANGFAGSSGPLPATAKHRPVGVTEGPDGSLFISDDRGGRIYRVMYIGH